MSIEAVASYLECPLCADGVFVDGKSLACINSHSFDIARQGYVNCLVGDKVPGTADTVEMVVAREQFLASDHFRPIADALAEAVVALNLDKRNASEAVARDIIVLDAGAGTGYYLGAVLGQLEASVGSGVKALGIATDISKRAVQRAAQAHPAIGALVADTWHRLPVASNVVDAIINVFAPRNADEFSRVLVPGGALVVVAPTSRHLAEIRSDLRMLDIDDDKSADIDEKLSSKFALEKVEAVEYRIICTRDDISHLVLMGPNAHHMVDADLATQLESWPDTTEVSISVEIRLYRCQK